MNDKNNIEYFVANECYLIHSIPNCNWKNWYQIVANSILRNATPFNNGIACFLPNEIRPATKKDFEDFRVCLPPEIIS